LPEDGNTFDPYKIVVSEIMLQQTQVPRVIPKFLEFIGRFPDFRTLAQAPLSDVLKTWSGLGYNRRAKFIWQLAQRVAQEYDGTLPDSLDKLTALPGIGVNTAGAIVAYAHNQPVIFLETNIRTVFIHHFFADAEKVTDTDIRPYIERTLPRDDTRQWYWALMDYGAHLKQTAGNATRRSSSYTRQSRFEGSRRQIRGRILRLLAQDSCTKAQLVKYIADERLSGVLDDLLFEGFIEQRNDRYRLRNS
jgi:A/G-specific adenine glycosylase